MAKAGMLDRAGQMHLRKVIKLANGDLSAVREAIRETLKDTPPGLGYKHLRIQLERSARARIRQENIRRK